tara:strand:- start:4 stop:237 length:234 start_codon:yes stop_codon:yes gene_type:complete
MNKLREQFEKETGIKHKEVHLMEQRVKCFDDSYVEWLESKLNNNEVLDLVSNCDHKGIIKDMFGIPKGRCEKCNIVF